MQKIVLNLLFSFFVVFNLAQAQDTVLIADPASFELSDLVEESLFSDDYYTEAFLGSIMNVSSDTLRLKWVREVVDAPAEWETHLGDNNITFPPFVDTNYDPDLGLNQALELAPQTSSFIGLFLLPHSVPGCGQYRIHFSTIENQDSILLTIPIDVCFEVMTSSDEIKSSSLIVLPNPVQSHFSLSEETQGAILLSNSAGKVVRTFTNPQQNHFSVENIPAGIYWLHISENKKTITLPIVIAP